MWQLFSSSSIPALTIVATIGAASADDVATKGVRIPHTGIWIEQVKASDRLDPNSMFGDVLGDNDALFVTKVEENSDRARPEVGDIIRTVDGWPMFNIKQLLDKVDFIRGAHEDSSIVTVVREDREKSVFLKIE